MVASIIAYIISGILCTLAFIGMASWALDKETKPSAFWGSLAVLILAYGAAKIGGI